MLALGSCVGFVDNIHMLKIQAMLCQVLSLTGVVGPQLIINVTNVIP